MKNHYKPSENESVRVAKSMRNYFMFFVPPITEQQAFEMPTTTAAREISYKHVPSPQDAEVKHILGIKYKHPKFSDERGSDEVFINYALEVSTFLRRTYDGTVEFVPLESDMK